MNPTAPPIGTTKPTQADVLKQQSAAAVNGLDLILPGEVVTYDAATQTAAVRVAIKGGFRGRDGQPVYEDRATLPGVPVCFPVSAAGSITWDLAAGDRVLILCGSRSLDEWKAQGGGGITARDQRRHALQDAFALPSLPCPAAPIPAEGIAAGGVVVAGADVRLGSGAAVEPVALTGPTMDYLSAIEAFLNGIAAERLLVNPADPLALAWVAAAAAFPATIGAARVKAL